MQAYSAYFHKERPLDANGLVLVSERFSWFAFLLPAIWALRHQLWVALGVYVAGSVLLQLGLDFVGASFGIQIVCSFAFAFLYASFAPEFRHLKLSKDGYGELGPVSAKTIDDAEKAALTALTNYSVRKIQNETPVNDQAIGSEE
ncbi:hypothetical protein A9Q83_15495 [Alphaproteobacteria bacterium 46_93_T64]|nr:hypothetical protein A9Q83_15495 [Alphaproteobacteria bacterium 46_93_T64]